MKKEKPGQKKENKHGRDIIENVEDDIYPSEEELASRLSSLEITLK